MRTVLVSLLVTAFFTLSLVSPVQAGGDRGVMRLGLQLLIGTVLALVGAIPPPAIANPPYPVPPMDSPPQQQQWAPDRSQEQLIPTTSRFEVWVPGYHDPYGNWTPAHDQTQIIPSGIATQVRVPGHSE